MPVTVQQVALTLLRYIGVTQLTPQAAGSELEDVQPWNLDDAAVAITQALHEYHELSPIENREKNSGFVLHAPQAVTLSASNGSQTIAGLGAWAAWMAGCTIRIAGDDQDNELTSATELARPYMGATGTGLAATVFGDAVTLPPEASRAVSPLFLPNQLPMPVCDDLTEFLRISGYPGLVDPTGFPAWGPFFYFIRKSTGRPRVAFAQGAYDSALTYVPRRLRFAPMPDQAYSLGGRLVLNPPRFTRADIVSPLQSLTVTGADDGNANQTYSYLCDINGYRAFRGNTNGAYLIFYAPWNSCYVLAPSFAAIAAEPEYYWQSNTITSPLGIFAPAGAATDVAVSTTTDSGGGAGDPGTIIPLVDAAVELVLLPMALQRFTATPSFRNEAAKAEIARQYKVAVDKIKNTRAIGTVRHATYR